MSHRPKPTSGDPAIREAIRAASSDEATCVAACLLLAKDAAVAAGLATGSDVNGARLEIAVARGMLHGWARGTATAQDVGAAYATLASKLSTALPSQK